MLTDGTVIVFAAICGLVLLWGLAYGAEQARRMRTVERRRRWRLVIEQDGTEHVSEQAWRSDEIVDMLDLEALMHEGTGWQVQRHGGGMIRAEKGATVRWIWVRA